MTNIGMFFKTLSELSRKVPKGPWTMAHENDSIVFNLGFTMIPNPEDQRILSKASVTITLPPGNVNLNMLNVEQANAFLSLVTLIPTLSDLLFELRKSMLEMADTFEKEAKSTDVKKMIANVRNELAFDGSAPGKIVTL